MGRSIQTFQGALRTLHRSIAPVTGILVAVFALSSLVYRVSRDYYGSDNMHAHFLLDIHDGIIYGGPNISVIYICLSWLFIGTQALSGFSMLRRCCGYRVVARDAVPPEELGRQSIWLEARTFHHFLAPLGGIVLLYKMFTAGTYQILTEGPPGRDEDDVHFLLDMHDARIPGAEDWFPKFWIFFVVIVALSMVISGLMILKKGTDKPKVARNAKVSVAGKGAKRRSADSPKKAKRSGSGGSGHSKTSPKASAGSSGSKESDYGATIASDMAAVGDGAIVMESPRKPRTDSVTEMTLVKGILPQQGDGDDDDGDGDAEMSDRMRHSGGSHGSLDEAAERLLVDDDMSQV